MIPEYCITEWRQNVPWTQDYFVEQDLIISRALVSLYKREKLRNTLAFRGGTALYKLYVLPPARYSEDIDLVQIKQASHGEIIDEIRTALEWLGDPIRKFTERSIKLIYKYKACDGTNKKLKIEINATENFHVFDLVNVNFSVSNSWFSGNTELKTYNLNELIGTKLRALYQRKKGRDLFDLWTVLENNLIEKDIVLNVFKSYCEKDKTKINKNLFESNMLEKSKSKEFRTDILSLIIDPESWKFDIAYKMVMEELILFLD